MLNYSLTGPRNCLGQHLALIEARIVLSLLLQRFTFVARDGACCCAFIQYTSSQYLDVMCVDQVGVPDEFIVPVCSRDGMHMWVR